jgi:hypothetical protein
MVREEEKSVQRKHEYNKKKRKHEEAYPDLHPWVLAVSLGSWIWLNWALVPTEDRPMTRTD